MAVYAIGDVHGCLSELQKLLDLLAFDPIKDRLLFVGDLVNRGPDSLGCLRFVRNLGERAVAVMGNHEINVLRKIATPNIPYGEPWLTALDQAVDREVLIDWISRLPLMHEDRETGFFVVHAGLHPLWSMEQALSKAAAIHGLAGGLHRVRDFYSPLKRSDFSEEQQNRLRMAWDDQAVLTRIRLTDDFDGRPVSPEEAKKMGLADPYGRPPEGFPLQPWFQTRLWKRGEKVIYGHWAGMGLTLNAHSKGLDSGCVYGGHLTALRLDHPELPVTQVACPNHAGFDRDG
ncbi:MAG: symmetrical bis(5'-nucleosyl)-tetraphosphatase [Magnetococcales bacterium]|nr:symmetrical bis(5'-nucleosyl)-tetraphosphatase [Magnetococcales bacterium]